MDRGELSLSLIHNHPRGRLQFPLLHVALDQTPSFSPINSPTLLDFIHDQVRAETQAQQAGQPIVMEMTGQQATTGQAAVTMSQAYSNGAGMQIWGNWGKVG